MNPITQGHRNMRLNQFIKERMDAILAEWESFAKTLLPAAGTMSALALRDHARQILQAIAVDIETSQNAAEQIAKSQGLSDDDVARESAASIHGELRQASNFSLLQLSAEFRALRATVLRLWLPQVKEMSEDSMLDMIRFNEAIDQALAESVVTYSARADHARELFLAILGHDLRAPLSSMTGAADMLTAFPVTPESAKDIGYRVRRGARLMAHMVEDLIGYTRTQLGAGMPTLLQHADITAICEAAINDAKSTHPSTTFKLDIEPGLVGQFDPIRLHQLFMNLLINAGQYGTHGGTVRVHAQCDRDTLTVRVNNKGPVIPAESIIDMFSPLIQLPGDINNRARTSLGLGLYIAREIALAHGGSIAVASNLDEGTTFTVALPMAPAPRED